MTSRPESPASRRRRGAIGAALLASTSVIAMAGIITPAAASAASDSPSGCSGNYVVGSAPLTNQSTGVASWNYGYVQLWYSNSCEENWARVVSLISDTTFVRADLFRHDGAHKCGSSSITEDGCTVTGTTTLESPPLYSPSLKDRVTALVETDSGTEYFGQWPQPGF